MRAVSIIPFVIEKGFCRNQTSIGNSHIIDATNRDFKAFGRITAFIDYGFISGDFAGFDYYSFDFVDCSSPVESPGSKRIGRYSFYKYTTVGSRKKRQVFSLDDLVDQLGETVKNAIDEAMNSTTSIPDDMPIPPSTNFTDTAIIEQQDVVDLGENSNGCEISVNEASGGCQNGGVCVDLPDNLNELYNKTSICNCADTNGFEGDYCEISTNECDIQEINCGGNGECSDFLGYAVCVCNSGFSGDSCEVDDFCAGNLCSGNGNCFNGACDCHSSEDYVRFGVDCEQIDYCQFVTVVDSIPVFNNFSCNFGECAQDETGAYCVCEEGYGDEGLSQYEETCSEQDPCLSADCGTNGSCYYSVGEYSCVCDYGFIGENCEQTDMCIGDANQCVLDFTESCQNDDSSLQYTCNCSEGYSGDFCDVSPCDIVSEFNTCDSTYSDLSTCLNGVCSCLGDSSRTDCATWGPVCDSNVVKLDGQTHCHEGNTWKVIKKFKRERDVRIHKNVIERNTISSVTKGVLGKFLSSHLREKSFPLRNAA